MKVKAGAVTETLQREPATTTSKRPPLAEHPKQRIQGGSDAISVVVVRPTRSRLSPGKLNRGEGRGGKDDAFKKVNGARMRRRHWSARRPKAFASTSNPLQSRGPNNATTTQGVRPACGHQEQQRGRHVRGDGRPRAGRTAAAAGPPATADGGKAAAPNTRPRKSNAPVPPGEPEPCAAAAATVPAATARRWRSAAMPPPPPPARAPLPPPARAPPGARAVARGGPAPAKTAEGGQIPPKEAPIRQWRRRICTSAAGGRLPTVGQKA